MLGLAWRHAQSRVSNGLRLRISPDLQTLCQCRKRPESMPTRISGFGQESGLLARLGISEEVLQKLRLHGPEESFLGCPEAWFAGWTLMFAHAGECQ